ncbi:MAG: hypothetical protein K2J70_06735 [Muribaculaceae bacterium]|nr:hypothetical protein [Muribaculaceae bacterium]
MPEITLSIPCEPYLAQWFRHDSGTEEIIELRKNSPESALLRVLLANKNSIPYIPPIPKGDELKIRIPHFKGMPPEYFNRISPRGEKAFIDLIRQRFDLRLFSDLSPILHAAHRRDELIYAWMEANGIEDSETNWCAVDKRLRRMIDRLQTKIRVRKYRAAKKKF